MTWTSRMYYTDKAEGQILNLLEVAHEQLREGLFAKDGVVEVQVFPPQLDVLPGFVNEEGEEFGALTVRYIEAIGR